VTVYLSRDHIFAVHAHQIRQFGGAPGLRDEGGLEASVARPQATYGGEDLYPDLAAKTAALMHSIVAVRHPFVDGNKRTGAHSALLFLLVNDMDPIVTPSSLTDVTLATARGEVSAEALAIWFRQHSRPRV